MFGEAEYQLMDYKYELEHTIFKEFISIQLQLIKKDKIKSKVPDGVEAVMDIAPKPKETIKSEEEVQQENIQNQVEKETQAQTEKWILPVSKGHKITSGYGDRIHPVQHTKKFHDGIDINAVANTPVYTVADGIVLKSEWYNGYGNYIEIDHGNNIHSFYGHLNKRLVTKGSQIKQGQQIGLSGNTGVGTGAHLHFGVHEKGDSVNPLNYLPNF